MEKVRMTLRIVPTLNEKLESIANQTGKSKNSLIVDACWEFIKKQKEYEQIRKEMMGWMKHAHNTGG